MPCSPSGSDAGRRSSTSSGRSGARTSPGRRSRPCRATSSRSASCCPREAIETTAGGLPAHRRLGTRSTCSASSVAASEAGSSWRAVTQAQPWPSSAVRWSSGGVTRCPIWPRVRWCRPRRPGSGSAGRAPRRTSSRAASSWETTRASCADLGAAVEEEPLRAAPVGPAHAGPLPIWSTGRIAALLPARAQGLRRGVRTSSRRRSSRPGAGHRARPARFAVGAAGRSGQAPG